MNCYVRCSACALAEEELLDTVLVLWLSFTFSQTAKSKFRAIGISMLCVFIYRNEMNLLSAEWIWVLVINLLEARH